MARCSVAISQSLDEDALSMASYTTNGVETQSAQIWFFLYIIYTHVIQNDLRTHPAGSFAAIRVG